MRAVPQIFSGVFFMRPPSVYDQNICTWNQWENTQSDTDENKQIVTFCLILFTFFVFSTKILNNDGNEITIGIKDHNKK